MTVTAGQASGERWLVAARLSRMSKRDREHPERFTGITSQDEKSTAWAESAGHVIVHVTRDKSVSGAVSPWERPELGPWLTDPGKVAQYDGIVGFDASRVSRDYADLPMLRKWAEKHGKKLYVIKERLSWPDDRDGMLWAVAAERSYQERQDTIERTTRELDGLGAAGKLRGNYPWGYTAIGEKYDRRLAAAPEGQRYIPEMFTRIRDGQPLSTVATWLSTAAGRTFTPGTVTAMIRNRTYAGEHRTAGGKYVHKCPALVGADLWEAANANLDSRPSPRRGQRTDLDATSALLSGLAVCGNPDCTAGPDSPMIRVRSRSGHGDAIRGWFYRCTGKGATHAKGCECGARHRRGCGNMVLQDAADALTDHAMSRLGLHVLKAVWHPAEGSHPEVASTKAAIRALDLDDAGYDAKHAELMAKLTALRQLPGRPAHTTYDPVLDDDGRPLTYGRKWERASQAERRAWLRDAGFRLELAKPEHEITGDEPQGGLASFDVYEDDRAAVIFRWSGEDDPGLGRGLAARDPYDDEED